LHVPSGSRGLIRFTYVTAARRLWLRLTHVVASMSPRLDPRWRGSFPMPVRNFTRSKHRA
ncbi:MAG: hypothetical protein WBV79_04845, partial [Rhodomicrobium sp.]